MSQARPQAWWRQATSDRELAQIARGHDIHAEASFLASQAAAEGLMGAIVALGLEPPHTHRLLQLLGALETQGVNGEALAALPLRALTRMTVSSRCPLDDTPPMDRIEPSDSTQAISTARALLAWVYSLDRTG